VGLRVVQVGLGPLGRIIAGELHTRGLGEIVAAVDVAPEIVGTDLADVAEGAASTVVTDDLESASKTPADCAIVTTSSDLRACMPTLRTLLTAGLSVVSTCEELLYPRLRHPDLADELDSLAKASGARVLGTGVNPGFLMDTLPLVATAVCRSVERIEVRRVQNAVDRRIPFQRKIGATLARERFDERVREGVLRHVGLGESLHFLAAGLGQEVEDWSESIEPVLADRRIESGLGPIEPGRASGVRQVAEGRTSGGLSLMLEFIAAVGQPDPEDRITIHGEPPFNLVAPGGIHGDIATCAMTLNAIASLLAAPPGLHTMATIPLACWRPSRPGS